MNLAISNIAWDKGENEIVGQLLKKYAFAGIEIAPTKIWKNPQRVKNEEIAEVKKFWENRGLKIIAAQALLFGHPELTIFENDEIRKKTLEFLRQLIILTSKLGAKAAIFGSPKNRRINHLDYNEALEIGVEFFRRVGEIAKKSQVFFCLEPNPKEYEADFLTDTKETVAFLVRVNHPNVKLNLDTGILNLNKENYRKSISLGLPYLKHFHISEPFLKQVNRKSKINHKMIASILKSLNYKQWISIEMKNGFNLEEAISYISTIYD